MHRADIDFLELAKATIGKKFVMNVELAEGTIDQSNKFQGIAHHSFTVFREEKRWWMREPTVKGVTRYNRLARKKHLKCEFYAPFLGSITNHYMQKVYRNISAQTVDEELGLNWNIPEHYKIYAPERPRPIRHQKTPPT